MGFEDPRMLLGLIGIAIPIGIHYWFRRKAPKVPFDALEVLVLSEGQKALSLRLIHRALLVSRIAIVLLTALLFARPYMAIPVERGFLVERPVALALVLDNSLSMRLVEDGKTLFSRAKERALEIIRSLPLGSEVFLVTASEPVEVMPSTGGGWEGRSAARILSRLEAGYGRANLGEALRLATLAVRRTQIFDKRVVVISDFQKTSWGDLPSSAEMEGISLVIEEVRPSKPQGNLALVKVEARERPQSVGTSVAVNVTVRNESDEEEEPLVTVRIGMHTVAGKIKCQRRSECEGEFSLGREGDLAVGEARLPPDSLDADNRRWFVVGGAKENGVLLVNGNPSRIPAEDEAYFVATALGLSGEDHLFFSVREVKPEEVSPFALSPVAAVALLNVRDLTQEQIDLLRTFVRNGGGLLVSAGRNAFGKVWKEGLQGLMPGPLREVVQTKEAQEWRWIEEAHPINLGPTPRTLAYVRSYAVLEPDWPEGVKVLAALDNGMPLLLENRYEKGLVLVWTSSLDTEWTDLPLRPAFAPFIRKVFAYITQTRGRALPAEITVGGRRKVLVEDSPLTVVTPTGAEIPFESSADFGDTKVPGTYRILEEGKKTPKEVFVVNFDPMESVLQYEVPLPLVKRPQGPYEGEQKVKRSLVPYLFVLILMLLGFEAFSRAPLSSQSFTLPALRKEG